MSSIPSELRRLVIARAGDCCEYCGLAQARQEAAFHIDHVVPRVAGGETALDNLALACVSCSLRKGGRTVSTDPDTGDSAPLFHPQREQWGEHFQRQHEWLIGLTPTGRATVALLQMNRPVARAIRAAASDGEAMG